jgi:hypothetical protein
MLLHVILVVTSVVQRLKCMNLLEIVINTLHYVSCIIHVPIFESDCESGINVVLQEAT